MEQILYAEKTDGIAIDRIRRRQPLPCPVNISIMNMRYTICWRDNGIISLTEGPTMSQAEAFVH